MLRLQSRAYPETRHLNLNLFCSSIPFVSHKGVNKVWLRYNIQAPKSSQPQSADTHLFSLTTIWSSDYALKKQLIYQSYNSAATQRFASAFSYLIRLSPSVNQD